ncbi:MAG: RluA family pseudouridine synthase [Flavobacteriales bacterium]
MGLFSSCATKSALKKILNKGLIRVNGEKATTATFIHGGEEIELIKEEISEPEHQLEYELHVLYEDEHLAAIYKPAGIAVSGNKFKTVANALEQNLSKSNLPDICHPQPAHRLDYPTTGVLLAGKTSSGIRALNLMFEKKEIEKSYLAVAIGEIKKLKGDFDEAIDDKEAFTSYEVLDSVISERFGFLNLVLLQPATGRRHQLRKHLSSRGNAILGDADYSLEGLLLKGKGLYLHAYSVEFTHPFTKENLTIQAPIPKKFLKLFPTILTTAFTKLDQTQ